MRRSAAARRRAWPLRLADYQLRDEADRERDRDDERERDEDRFRDPDADRDDRLRDGTF